jgi:hypothetical protein
MPAIPIIAGVGAIVGAGAAVVGTVSSINAQNKAAAANREQFEYQKQINNNKAVRERRDAIRAARLTGGQVLQAAETQGAGSTSAALGGQGSIVSQLNNNLSFLDTQQSLADKAGAASQVADTARASASNWGAVSGLGMAIFNVSAPKAKF